MVREIATLLVSRAAAKSPDPTWNPTRIVVAMPNARGNIKVRPPRFIAMVCAAIISEPNLPSRIVIKENIPISKNIVAPIGAPIFSNAIIRDSRGADHVFCQPTISKRLPQATRQITKNSNHITIAVATPHPTPPIAGAPK